MMKEKDLEGSQMRAGEEDGTRDWRPSKKMTMMLRTRNSSTCFPESWPKPWDDKRVFRQNLLPCSNRKNTKIYSCS